MNLTLIDFTASLYIYPYLCLSCIFFTDCRVNIIKMYKAVPELFEVARFWCILRHHFSGPRTKKEISFTKMLPPCSSRILRLKMHEIFLAAAAPLHIPSGCFTLEQANSSRRYLLPIAPRRVRRLDLAAYHFLKRSVPASPVVVVVVVVDLYCASRSAYNALLVPLRC